MGKPIVAPTWARQEDVKGYTASRCIDPSLLDAWTKAATTRDPRQVGKHFLDHDRLSDACRNTFSKSSLPSVYYENGHATLQHDEPGWEGGQTWLFFQNLPVKDWGHFGKTQRAKDILKKLDVIIKANPNLSMEEVFTKYVAQHLGRRAPDSAFTKRAGNLKTVGQTARLILAAELRGEYGTCCSETSWNLAAAGSSKLPSDPRLLEIYDEASVLKTHPSRNRFYPTTATELKTVLHCLAISPAMWDANPHIQKNHKKPPSGRRTEAQ